MAGDLHLDRNPTGAIAISGATQATALVFDGTLRGTGLISGGYDTDGRLHARIALDTGSYVAEDRDLQGISGSLEVSEDRFGARSLSGSLLYEAGTLSEISFMPGRIEGDLSLPADLTSSMTLDLRLDHGGAKGPNLEVGTGALLVSVEGSLFGKLKAQAVFDADRIEFEQQSAEGALLDADIELDRMVPQRIQARLIHRGLRLGDVAQDAGVVQARLIRRSRATQARLDWGWGLIEAAIDAHEDTLEQPADFRMDAKLDMRRLRALLPASLEEAGTLRLGIDGHLARPLDLMAGRLEATLAPGSRITLDGAKFANGISLVGPTALFIGPDGAQVSADAEASRWRYRIGLAPFPATLHIPGRAGTVRAALGPVASSGANDAPLDIAIRNSSVAVPNLGMLLNDLSAGFQSDGGTITASLDAREIRQTSRKPFLAPLTLGATVHSADGSAFSFDARLTRPGTPLSIAVEGRHDLSTGIGKASLRTGDIAFKPDRLQPEDVFPGVAGIASRFEGKVSVDGDYRWTDAGIDATQRIAFDRLNFDLNDGRINALNGTVRIDGLANPRTPPHQRLTAVILTRSLEATPMELAFQLRDASHMTVEKFAVDIAGGRLQALDVPVDLEDASSASRRLAFGIDVHRIDFAEIFRLIGVDGLSGTGRISGRIPVTIAGNRMSVSNGALHSEGPGRLGYSGTELAQTLGTREDVVGMAMDALADFRYETLSLELQKRPDGEGNILLQMTGANPETLAGHPFRFNIRFTSDFDRLADFVLMGTDVAGTLMRWATGREPVR
ncbi:MAG: YdbH domain-containing protein [Alphaproteobacteria bacterium]